MQTRCVECGEPIQGRVDKIYCTPYCKSSYHYRKKQDQGETQFKKIDKQLKVNRRLLKHFNTAGKSTIRSEKLLGAGFDPDYFTHYWKNSNGKIYLFCYDVGYLKLQENGKTKYLLIDWQPKYMSASNREDKK